MHDTASVAAKTRCDFRKFRKHNGPTRWPAPLNVQEEDYCGVPAGLVGGGVAVPDGLPCGMAASGAPFGGGGVSVEVSVAPAPELLDIDPLEPVPG